MTEPADGPDDDTVVIPPDGRQITGTRYRLRAGWPSGSRTWGRRIRYRGCRRQPGPRGPAPTSRGAAHGIKNGGARFTVTPPVPCGASATRETPEWHWSPPYRSIPVTMSRVQELGPLPRSRNDVGGPQGESDRRGSVRTARQNSATSLIQTLLRDPVDAATSLERDLEQGAAPGMVLALLDAAEALAGIRGLDLSQAVGGVRARISRKIQRR